MRDEGRVGAGSGVCKVWPVSRQQTFKLSAANAGGEPKLLIRQYAAKVFFLKVGVQNQDFCASGWLMSSMPASAIRSLVVRDRLSCLIRLVSFLLSSTMDLSRFDGFIRNDFKVRAEITRYRRCRDYWA
ncbi:hypothetical protein ACFFU4_01950 [Roseovarius ramblicola]|uniref:Uncharacterized protein n=1 Tax=Roseovarius ramblicola TaxID=2022336 RepID=A0ABV5HVR1_9RHOB